MKKSTEKSLQFFFGRYLSEPLYFLEKSLIPNNTNEVAKGMVGFFKGIYEDFDEEEFFFELEKIKNAYENEFAKKLEDVRAMEYAIECFKKRM